MVAETAVPAHNFPPDDLNDQDGRLILYPLNGNLDTTTDPWFKLRHNETLTLFDEDLVIDSMIGKQ